MTPFLRDGDPYGILGLSVGLITQPNTEEVSLEQKNPTTAEPGCQLALREVSSTGGEQRHR